MNKLKFEFTEVQLNNLFVFLDKSNFNGLKEVQAINELVNILSNPIVNEEGNEIENKNAINDMPEMIKEAPTTPEPKPAPEPQKS